MLGFMLGAALHTAAPSQGLPPAVPLPVPRTPFGHPPEGAMHGLIAIFDMVCNRVFPDDKRLDALNRIPNTRELTPDEVRTYLKTDPGRGWVTTNGPATIVITIEEAPVHACAVRMPHTDGQIDEAWWRRFVQAAEARAGGGFSTMPPQNLVIGDMRTLVMGDQRQNPDRSAEAFYLFRTAPADPARAPGYGVELRLVHQIVAAGAR